MDQGNHMANGLGQGRRLVVAVDDGYARTKVCVPQIGAGDALWGSVPIIKEFGTVITRGVSATSSADGTESGTWVADGQQFSVDEYVAGDTVATDDYHWSAMNRVLVNHYLVQCGLSAVDIDLLVVGLPMSQFYTPTGKRSDVVDKKITSLMRPVIPVGETKQPARIKEVKVVPQGRSALFDHVVGWDLKAKGRFQERTAIIDIGGRTTDLAYILNGQKNDVLNSGSIQIGVLDVLGHVNTGLMDHFDRPSKFPPQLLNRALRERRVDMNGARHDVSDIVDAAIELVVSRLIGEIRATIKDADIADEIIIVGGGAAVFGSALRKSYPGALIPDDPSWANVRGFWKIGAASRVNG